MKQVFGSRIKEWFKHKAGEPVRTPAEPSSLEHQWETELHHGETLNAIKLHRRGIYPTERAMELMEGDVATEHDMRDLLTDMVEREGTKSMVAAQLGISGVYLGDILLGRRPMGSKIAKSMGWEKATVYVKRPGKR